jgi:hypothetical protein
MPRVISDNGGRSFPPRRVIEEGPGTRLSNNALNGRNQELSYSAMIEDAPGAWPSPSTATRSSASGLRRTGSIGGNVRMPLHARRLAVQAMLPPEAISIAAQMTRAPSQVALVGASWNIG